MFVLLTVLPLSRLILSDGSNCNMNGESYVNDPIISNIKDCIFINYHTAIYGSVISISSSLLISVTDSSFFNCSSSKGCGAIYYFCDSGKDIVLSRICASTCFTTTQSSYYQFSYLRTGSKFINLSMITMIKCAPDSVITRNEVFSTQNGYQNLKNMNITSNRANIMSGMRLESATTLEISHSTFSQNTADYAWCLSIYSSSNSPKLEFSNFVNNQHLHQSLGTLLLYSYTYLTIRSSFFKNNPQCLFELSSSSLTVYTSVIVHNNQVANIPISTDESNIITQNLNTETMPLSHYSSNQCNNLIVLPTLRSKILVPVTVFASPIIYWV